MFALTIIVDCNMWKQTTPLNSFLPPPSQSSAARQALCQAPPRAQTAANPPGEWTPLARERRCLQIRSRQETVSWLDLMSTNVETAKCIYLYIHWFVFIYFNIMNIYIYMYIHIDIDTSVYSNICIFQNRSIHSKSQHNILYGFCQILICDMSNYAQRRT